MTWRRQLDWRCVARNRAKRSWKCVWKAGRRPRCVECGRMVTWMDKCLIETLASLRYGTEWDNDAEFRGLGTTSIPFGVLWILCWVFTVWLIFFPFCHSANGIRWGANLSKNSCGSLARVQCDIGRSFREKVCGICTNRPRSVKALGSVAIFLICGDSAT